MENVTNQISFEDMEVKPFKESFEHGFKCIVNYVKYGKGFRVEITHWGNPYEMEKTLNNPQFKELFESGSHIHTWNVYAIIYQNHPLYKSLKKIDNDDYNTANEKFNFPFHGGVTFVRNENSYIKIGDDYQHYMDDESESWSLPLTVEYEANKLFEYLKSFTE